MAATATTRSLVRGRPIEGSPGQKYVYVADCPTNGTHRRRGVRRTTIPGTVPASRVGDRFSSRAAPREPVSDRLRVVACPPRQMEPRVAGVQPEVPPDDGGNALRLDFACRPLGEDGDFALPRELNRSAGSATCARRRTCPASTRPALQGSRTALSVTVVFCRPPRKLSYG